MRIAASRSASRPSPVARRVTTCFSAPGTGTSVDEAQNLTDGQFALRMPPWTLSVFGYYEDVSQYLELGTVSLLNAIVEDGGFDFNLETPVTAVRDFGDEVMILPRRTSTAPSLDISDTAAVAAPCGNSHRAELLRSSPTIGRPSLGARRLDGAEASLAQQPVVGGAGARRTRLTSREPTSSHGGSAGSTARSKAPRALRPKCTPTARRACSQPDWSRPC
jgi:hypothetical protein